jgi:AraC-like DNA-binding protein
MATIAGTTIRAWKPMVPGVREVLHARFAEHAYPPHTHEAWTLFIVDDGAIRYDLDRHERGAEPPMVSILPPYVVHDGRPATRHGYRTRVLYLEPSVLGEDLIGPAVDRSWMRDRWLRRRVSALHDRLACRDDALAAEASLASVIERIGEALGAPVASASSESRHDTAEAFRAFLDAHLYEPVTIASAAAHLGSGPTQLARAFRAVFGITPHAYVTGRRLDTARDRILDGQSLAEVAVDVGFVDQAHLTRRFKRFLGTTPGRFARG